MNYKINKIQQKTVRLVYKNETNLPYDDLQKKDRLVYLLLP